MTQDQTPGRLRLAAVAFLLAVTLFLALLPVTAGGVSLERGDIAFRTIRAPRDISFESAALTAQRREDAGNAVPDSLIYDPSVAVAQQTGLGSVLSRLQAVLNDATLTPPSRLTALGRVDRLSLSQRSASILLSLSPTAYDSVQAEARRALGAILDQSLPPTVVGDTRERALSFIAPGLDRDTATLVADLVRPFIVANLTVDSGRTEAARAAARSGVAPVRVSYAKGQTVVDKDTPISAEAREALIQGSLVNEGWNVDLLGAASALALFTAVGVVAAVRAFRPAAFAAPRQLVLIALALAVPVFLMKIYLPFILPDDERHFLAFVMPMAAAGMVLCGVLGAELGLVVAVGAGMLAAFASVYLSDLTAIGLAGTIDVLRIALCSGFAGIAGVLALRSADRFGHFLLGGLVVGLSVLAVLGATWLIDPNRDVNDFAWMALAAGANGGLSAFLSVGIFVTLGGLFGVTTRVQLLEMSQLSQPLLSRLQDEAPATFQHSVIVANLSEKGAYVIGADAVLARVGCYYHDIGKIMRPGFYVENQFGGDNPHDALEPADSARIIIDHVSAGLALARRYRLPGRVAAFIPEHHGTRLVTYFYRIAFEEDPTVSAEPFRYPGPRPQSRETAIAMLADSCEAVVRASAEHTPERISELVDEVFAERLAESQLDESDLTLRNLKALAESFKGTLRAVYHPRVEYPAPTEAELRMRRPALPRILDRR